MVFKKLIRFYKRMDLEENIDSSSYHKFFGQVTEITRKKGEKARKNITTYAHPSIIPSGILGLNESANTLKKHLGGKGYSIILTEAEYHNSDLVLPQLTLYSDVRQIPSTMVGYITFCPTEKMASHLMLMGECVADVGMIEEFHLMPPEYTFFQEMEKKTTTKKDSTGTSPAAT